MTNRSSSSSRRRARALAGASAAAAALAIPAAAGAQPLDPALYQTGVPAGVVEHGVVAIDITGVPHPSHTLTEYWATSTGWRSVTRDASGDVISRALSTADGSAFETTHDESASFRIAGPSTPPYAGWSAAYNKKLVDAGELVAQGDETVAGIAGTKYVVPDGKKSSDPNAPDGTWVTDDVSAQTIIVLERGTDAPLVRETIKPHNGAYGTFDQRESLVSRDRTGLTRATASAARVTSAALAKLKAQWRHEAKAAKHRAS